MRVGIFGGSFNPPHVGHLIIAEYVRERLRLERIVWVPAAVPPHKSLTGLASADDRFEMTRLAVGGNSYFDVSRCEIDRDGVSFTVDTLRELGGANPEWELFLLIGSDSYRQLDQWQSPSTISEIARIVVYPRHTDAEMKQQKYRAEFVDAPVIELSSTMIRQRIRDGRSIRYFVPDAVGSYILRNGLYREDSD